MALVSVTSKVQATPVWPLAVKPAVFDGSGKFMKVPLVPCTPMLHTSRSPVASKLRVEVDVGLD